ncbi:MAG: 50S ribosomal protein L11 methyltransferase [Candidatus Omnitrophica bacterium]|nr:50S ribosomal protein L11 methyltransferase [Candidatus Omnitrophota bacterium]
MSSEHIYELSVSLSGRKASLSGLIRDMLVRLGTDEKDIVEYDEKGRVRLSVYFSDEKKAVQAVKGFSGLGLKGVPAKLNCLGDSWKTAWKKHIKPFTLAGRFRVVPLKEESGVMKMTKKDIYIDSILAFGMGTHPTTKLVAEMMVSTKPGWDTFFDIGTGTGILAIIASKLGSSTVWAVDIDPESIETAMKNSEGNDVTLSLIKTADIMKFGRKKKFDLVAANLITHDLLTFRKKILSFVAPGGYLIVSGVSSDNYKTFRRSFDGKGLKCLKAPSERGWHAVMYRYC